MIKLITSALRKPVTVMVLVCAIIFFSAISISKIAVDIFPSLDLPSIYIVQPYGGMAPEEMDALIATKYQDHFLYVSGIRNVDVKTIQGLCLIKLEFYPGTDMAQAAAEVSNNVARAKAYMPEGTVPPQVIRFDASSVPVGQLVFKSSNRSLGEIQDMANSRVRSMFSKIPGVSSPPPLGGNQRTVVIQIDPSKIQSYRVTPEEIIKAVIANNQPSPAGNIRIGELTYMTPVNSFVKVLDDFKNIPVRTEQGTTVYIRDVGTVVDATDITVSYALVNGKRAVYIPVVKKSDASTLEVVNNIKAALPTLQNSIPGDVMLSYEFDQSGYVTNALKNLVTEGALGALLTGLMVFLFLRDWRSVVIVVVTIPISIMAAVILLGLTGQTINIMTLSGLALAIGVLVDQATVTIENIHQHLESGKPKALAILTACREIIFPEFLILLSILAVFVPSFMMTGVPKSMFLPLSLSVGFAMIASFFLSQTFVPVLANWLLKEHAGKEVLHPDILHPETEKFHSQKTSGFDRFRLKYLSFLEKGFENRKKWVVFYFIACIGISGLSFFFIGTEILPSPGGKQFQLRIKAPDGTRVERTEKLTLEILNIIKEITGDENILISSAYIGTVPSSYGTSNIFVFNSGPHESVMQVAIGDGYTPGTSALKELLREEVKKKHPDVNISFEPIELVDKIMSQGASTPIEINVAAKDINEAGDFAGKIIANLKKISYLRDVQIAQPLKYPIIDIEINRERAALLGLTSTQIARSMVAGTSSSRFTDKNIWLDYKKGLGYQVQVQIPLNEMRSISELGNIPLKSGQLHPTLSEVAVFKESTAPGQFDRSGPNRLVTIKANLHNKDLGTATKDIREAISLTGEPPRGMLVDLKGQAMLLAETLNSLQTGLLIAVVIIFLLLTANFQSFRLSLVILSSIPAVVAGSLILLLICGATLNLQSYMGIIMSVGVSVANAILMVTNAESNRLELRSAREGAKNAANNRVRPILMTSIAMIAGMIPMALGMGEGGEQIAPLGQAVIGGLIASSIASLFIIPLLFILLQEKVGFSSISMDPEDPSSRFHQLNKPKNE